MRVLRLGLVAGLAIGFWPDALQKSRNPISILGFFPIIPN